jgi:hypothetical protein
MGLNSSESGESNINFHTKSHEQVVGILVLSREVLDSYADPEIGYTAFNMSVTFINSSRQLVGE